MKKRTITFRRKAMEDIADIASYIAADSPQAAQAFREALEHACALLADMPDVGISRSFGNPKLADVRLWPLKRFEKYLLLYRAYGDTVDVIRVVHGARDLPALFSEPEE
jgi:toxin ParE1/3/4